MPYQRMSRIITSIICAAYASAQLAPNGFPTLSTASIASLSAAITADFGMSASFGTPCNPCTQGDTYGALVRLAFHDAFGGGGLLGSGGSNGTS